MNGHTVIPHRSHFTWQRTALVISQDFAGLQLAVLNLPATAVQREKLLKWNCKGHFMISRIKFIIISSMFEKIVHCRSRVYRWRYFIYRYWAESQKYREKRERKTEENYCMMSGLEEQLYVGRYALFDLETIKCAFLSLLEESCVTGDFTVETDHGNTAVIPWFKHWFKLYMWKYDEHLLPYNN